MRLLTVIKLSFHILLCQNSVRSSRYSIIEDQMSSNILVDFFEEFNEAYLERVAPRRIVIVGGLAPEYQEAVQPLMENHPFTICTELKNCQIQVFSDAPSFIVVFINEAKSEEALKKDVKILSSCTSGCKLMYVVNGFAVESQIRYLLFGTHKLNGPICELVHLDQGVVKHYGLTLDENCTLSIYSLFAWRPGVDLDGTASRLYHEQDDMHGCPISVGSFPYEPEMIIGKNKNGKSIIVGGRDGMMALMIAKELNFTIALKQPRVSSGVAGSRKLAMLEDIEARRVHFAVGRFRPTSGFEYSIPFDEECITFAVPRNGNHVGVNIIWIEFPWQVWIIVGSIFLVGCTLEYIRRTMIHTRNGDQRNPGFVSTLLDVVSIHLGLPVTRTPASVSGKLMFVIYLCYAVVMTTAYKASFASILTKSEVPPPITDSRGIIEGNLKLGGSLYHFRTLMEQAGTGEVISELIKRYEICEDNIDGMRRLKVDKDFAFLARRSYLIHEMVMAARAQEYFEFDILEECVASYPLVLAFRNGSRLLEPVNKVISSLVEGDILGYRKYAPEYKDAETLKRDNDNKFYRQLMKLKFRHIFIWYCCCLVVCILVFGIELIIARFKPKRRQPIDRSDILL